jgi:cell wall-associated NlpC family hydrolase
VSPSIRTARVRAAASAITAAALLLPTLALTAAPTGPGDSPVVAEQPLPPVGPGPAAVPAVPAGLTAASPAAADSAAPPVIEPERAAALTAATERASRAAPYAGRHQPGVTAIASAPPTGAIAGTGTGTEAAVLYAIAQVGKQYVYGSAGPNTFDCSGLVVAAFRRAGVTLPHNTRAMRSAGRHVERSAMRRGDVLWLEGGGHVGIYLGNGLMVHAANERVDIRIGPVYETPVEVRRMIG